MGDIELVIKIPEEEYELCKKQYDTECLDVLMTAVKYGTPLPKGHGRLIDADYKVSSDGRTIDAVCGYIAPTIIEADREQGEKMKEEKPYIVETITMQNKKYNPNYGDLRMCVCGHTYYRHFDPWDDMEAVRCKYCGCEEFIEADREG